MAYRMSIPKGVAARQQAQKVERVERGKVEEERQLPRPVGPVGIQTILGVVINALIIIPKLQPHATCATMAGEILKSPLSPVVVLTRTENLFEAKSKTKRAWMKNQSKQKQTMFKTAMGWILIVCGRVMIRFTVYIVLVSAHSQIINLLVEVHELLVIVTYSIYVIADDDGQGTNCKSLLICLASCLFTNFKSFEM